MANPLLASLLAQLQRNQHSMGTPISIANTANSQVIGTAAFSFARCHFFEFKVYWRQPVLPDGVIKIMLDSQSKNAKYHTRYAKMIFF